MDPSPVPIIMGRITLKMHTRAGMIDRLKAMANVAVIDRDSAWHAEIKKGPDLVFKVTVPKTVLEWFACAKKDGREVWSDWTEHYATAQRSPAELEEEMARDVADFVRRVLDSEFTSSVFPGGSASLLWKRPDGQQHVTIYEPKAE